MCREINHNTTFEVLLQGTVNITVYWDVILFFSGRNFIDVSQEPWKCCPKNFSQITYHHITRDNRVHEHHVFHVFISTSQTVNSFVWNLVWIVCLYKITSVVPFNFLLTHDNYAVYSWNCVVGAPLTFGSWNSVW